MSNCFELIDKLYKNRTLSLEEYEMLLDNQSEENEKYISEYARKNREEYYGKDIYVRGLIEISNICKNDCLYCGIRRSNLNCDRYRIEKEEILDSCKEGYELGFRTFVLQGGEDAYFTDDRLLEIVSKIKEEFPDVAVTLSVGERDETSYRKLFEAGVDRYLLRHETADKNHYEKIHPVEMSFENRIKCLENLKRIGYQTGAGFMVGSPYQTNKEIAKDLKFIENLKPEMCGIGPFIAHKDTSFKNEKSGSISKTLYILSIVRLILPAVLLPATTAVGTLDKEGYEKAILAGANVIMPNLTPKSVRSKYELYNKKAHTGVDAGENIRILKERMNKIGYKIISSRGDAKKEKESYGNI